MAIPLRTPDAHPASLPTVPLAALAPGETGFIAGIDATGSLGRRLLDLGFVPGTRVRVLRRAPLGDPVSYELRGARLCLRRAEARQIAVVRSAPDSDPGR